MIIYKVSSPEEDNSVSPTSPQLGFPAVNSGRNIDRANNVWQDIITGDEIISDSYDLKEVDGTVYEVDCAMITLGAVEVST
jgi:hypothetical protein